MLCFNSSIQTNGSLKSHSIGGKEMFIEAGGEHYEFIPCLNDNADHMTLLAQIVKDQSLGWT